MSEFEHLCERAGMTLPKVAAEFGVSEALADDWQHGRSDPPTQVLRTLDLLTSFAEPIGVDQFLATTKQQARSGTFIDNMKLPIHRWFRYSAGFSAQWVENVIEDRCKRGECSVLLDPFAGSGTALLAAQRQGIRSIGIEPHPFVHEVANVKLNWNVDASELKTRAEGQLHLPGRLLRAFRPAKLHHSSKSVSIPKFWPGCFQFAGSWKQTGCRARFKACSSLR